MKYLLLGAALAGLWPQAVLAQHVSPNYRIEESSFGTGGQNQEAGSTNFRGRASLGDLGVGNASSTNFQAYGGFTTTDEMYLEFIVVGGTKDLGVLTTTTTGTATAAMSVRTYLASGYVVTVNGSPPTNSGYSLSPLATEDFVAQGVEQFGLNLRNNAIPDIGADPVQVPDSTFSFGAVAGGYNTVDKFKFVNNSTVASSPKSSGQTDYTLSFIANVSSITPGGTYNTTLTLVATPTF